MATKSEIIELFDFLTTVYPPNEKQEKHLADLVSIWTRSFAETPQATLKRAVDLYVEKGIWFPKPAEIWEQIKRAENDVAREEERQFIHDHLPELDSLRELRAWYECNLYSGEVMSEELRALAGEFTKWSYQSNAAWCINAAERIEHDRSNANPIPASIPTGATIPA